MTATEFRQNADLVSQWSGMLREHQLLRLVVFDVMYNEHPCNYALHPDKNGDISETRSGIELGVTRGYSKYDGLLKMLGTPKKPAQQLPDPEYKPEPTNT